MKLYFTSILILSMLTGSIVGYQIFKPFEISNTQLPLTSPEIRVQQTQIPQGSSGEESEITAPFLPVRIRIPKLNIDTVVEEVGVDKDNNMDVPKQPMNVGWFNLGYKPGQVGNSVIAGHFDKKNRSPAIFYNLTALEIGDTFSVLSSDGRSLTFKVTGRRTYETENFPLETVFGSHSKARLNLITCSGIWNTGANTYTKRTVVFSELVE